MLFLFDIDGTLLRRMPPAHRQALCDAAASVYGVTLGLAELGQTAGMTDTAIARRALLAAGITTTTFESHLADFFAATATAFDAHVAADLTPYHTPFAAPVVSTLRQRGVPLGLLTGNVERIAWRKMRAAGFGEVFACGAFGDEAEAREALPPLALRRAAKTFGHDFAPEEIYIIGDTPADIACGQAHGLRTVAVATGPIHTREALAAYAPTHVFDDLRGLIGLLR